jgi:hypothetical protein
MTRRIQQWTSVIGIEWLLEDAARWNLVWTDRWTGKLKAENTCQASTPCCGSTQNSRKYTLGLAQFLNYNQS